MVQWGKLRPERMLVRCGVNAADRANAIRAGSPHPIDHRETIDTVAETWRGKERLRLTILCPSLR
jgi:hypothetical protein